MKFFVNYVKSKNILFAWNKFNIQVQLFIEPLLILISMNLIKRYRPPLPRWNFSSRMVRARFSNSVACSISGLQPMWLFSLGSNQRKSISAYKYRDSWWDGRISIPHYRENREQSNSKSYAKRAKKSRSMYRSRRDSLWTFTLILIK